MQMTADFGKDSPGSVHRLHLSSWVALRWNAARGGDCSSDNLYLHTCCGGIMCLSTFDALRGIVYRASGLPKRCNGKYLKPGLDKPGKYPRGERFIFGILGWFWGHRQEKGAMQFQRTGRRLWNLRRANPDCFGFIDLTVSPVQVAPSPSHQAVQKKRRVGEGKKGTLVAFMQ